MSVSKIYFVQSELGGPIKIGCTTDVNKRLNDLQTGSPLKLILLGTIYGNYEEEKKLHNKFEKYRIHGEWFDLSLDLFKYLKNKRINVLIKIFPGINESQKFIGKLV